jgi:DNA repair protein RadA/Sms
MARNDKVAYACAECGLRSPKWLGRCTGCGGWSTFSAVRAESGGNARSALPSKQPIALDSIEVDDAARMPTGIGELDRVLGGGLVAGAVVLIGGDPGVGKSTLLMQVTLAMARAGRSVLYVTGEESAAQVALRARRLGSAAGALLLATTELGDVISAVEDKPPALVVIDSVQTLRAADLDSAPGSLVQLRETSARLIDLAKQRDCAMFLIGHVTKDGTLAGPKVLEHLVDVVLSFEGDAVHAYRLLRGQKNRFGPTHEVGVFEMVSEGLREVADPSASFMGDTSRRAAGSAVVPTVEGSRSMLVEVQALVAPAQYGAARRVVSGLDANRLAVLLAVLHRKAGVQVLDQDVFASVAGGLRVDEPAVDLAICAAAVSALRERPLADGLLAFGEVGLTGELRGVGRAAVRVAEARKLGFTRIVLPSASAQRLSSSESAGVELLPVERVEQALALLF